MATIGSLVVQLSADVAHLRKDFDAATRVTRNFADSVTGSMSKLGGVIAGALSVGAVTGFTRSIVEAAKEAEQASNRMSAVLKATGNAVGLTKKQIDDLADSLAQSTQFDDESIRNAASQFIKFGNIQEEVFTKALKLSTDLAAFMGTDVAQAAQLIGKALSSPEEGLGRLERQIGKLSFSQREMIEQFIKTSDVAGAQGVILDALQGKIGGTAEKMNTGLTKSTSDAGKAWDELLEAFGKTKFIQSTVTSSLDATTNSLKAMQDVIESGSIKEFFGGLLSSPGFLGMSDTAKSILPAPFKLLLENIKQRQEASKALTKGSGNAEEEKRAKEAAAAARERDALDKELERGKKNLEALSKKVTSRQDDTLKRNLEQRLKLIENSVEREKDIESTRNKFLDFYYNENEMSTEQYYAARNAVIQENLSKTLKYYDAEIGALKAFASQALQADAINAQTKINDLIQKKRKLETEAATESQMNWLMQTKAAEEYEKMLKNIDAQLAASKGNLGESAGIQFDLSNADLKKLLEAQNNQPYLRKLEDLRKSAVAQADLNKLSEEASILQDQLANKEARIDIDRKLGAKSELDSLVAISAARKKSAEELRGIAENMKRVAEESDNKRLIQNAENFRVQIEELAASSNLLRDKFSNMFESGFADFFEKVASGTESLKDAFKSMVNDINRQLLRLAVEDVAGKLFGGASGGGGGILSGVGEWFAGLFGGARAGGGGVSAGMSYIVGEKGPELFTPGASGMITPNHAMGNSVTVNMNISGNQSMSRASWNQIGLDLASKINKAQIRNS